MIDSDKNQDKMLHEVAHDLVTAIITYCSSVQSNEFLDLEEAEIEDLYMQWPKKLQWRVLTMPERNRIAAFVDWATMSPIERYKLARKGK